MQSRKNSSPVVDTSTAGGGGARHKWKAAACWRKLRGRRSLLSRHGFVVRYADDRFAISTTSSSAHHCILPMYAMSTLCLASSQTPAQQYISIRSSSDRFRGGVFLAKSPGKLVSTVLVRQRNETDISGPSPRNSARIR